MLELELIAFSSRPVRFRTRAAAGSLGSRTWSFYTCSGLRLRRAGPELAYRPLPYCLPSSVTPSAPWNARFRSSIQSLHMPLSTLPVQRYRRPHMTRGQDGLLGLSCRTLSFLTPCRFIPTLSTLKSVRHGD